MPGHADRVAALLRLTDCRVTVDMPAALSSQIVVELAAELGAVHVKAPEVPVLLDRRKREPEPQVTLLQLPSLVESVPEVA